MRPNRNKLKIVEPPLGLVGVVADDQMVSAKWVVTHKEANLSIRKSGLFLAEDDGILCIADGHRANAQIVVEIHINGLTNVARLDVGAAHVTVHQRAFDIYFVLVADEVARIVSLTARSHNQSDDCDDD